MWSIAGSCHQLHHQFLSLFSSIFVQTSQFNDLFNHLSPHSQSLCAQEYLLHCLCRRYRAFPWPRDTQLLSILAGRCSAIRWLPECTVRYCCRDLGSPLGTRQKPRRLETMKLWGQQGQWHMEWDRKCEIHLSVLMFLKAADGTVFLTFRKG